MTGKRNSTPLRKGEKTRRLVLQQAAKLFANKGYDGVTMDKLASASKLTKGALYTHFKSKYEIYVESAVRYMNVHATNRPSFDNSQNAEKNLEEYLSWLLDIFENDKTYRLLLIRLFIDADQKTTKLIAEQAFTQPVVHLNQLIHAYKPTIDALQFVYSVTSIAMLNPDLSKAAAAFAKNPDLPGGRPPLLDHLLGIIKNA